MIELYHKMNSKDIYLAKHQTGTAYYSTIIAIGMGLTPEDVSIVQYASMTHDLGKLGIPKNILMKTTGLTENEWQIVKQHPLDGAEILSRQLIAPDKKAMKVIEAVRSHHERWNGSGYPFGIKNKEIPIAARIIAVADSFDAMTTDRPYQKAIFIEDAIIELEKYSGILYDPQVVNVAAKEFLLIMPFKRMRKYA